MTGGVQGRDGDFASDIDAIEQIAAVPTILEVVCRTTCMGFAAVARVTEDRWVACGVRDEIAFGLQPGGELQIETTICNEIRHSTQGVAIDEVAKSKAFADHHTPKLYGFQSYISMPITLPDGRFFGTLCAIDPKPAKVENMATVAMFQLFAQLIAFHLDAHEKLAASAAQLDEVRQTAELREQFIAVLGHDLRNPLASMDAGVTLLSKSTLNERERGVLDLMKSSVWRMSAMIDDVLDFARGRLGGGIPVKPEPNDIGPALAQVVAELRSSRPGRRIESHIAIDRTLNADPGRIGQLLSNLLANALTHGHEDTPVQVVAETSDTEFVLSVTNAGDPIRRLPSIDFSNRLSAVRCGRAPRAWDWVSTSPPRSPAPTMGPSAPSPRQRRPASPSVCRQASGMRRLWIALCIVAASSGWAAAQSPVRPALGLASGVYDGEMLIGVDPATRAVTGYYASETGAGRFSCIFFLSGRLGVGAAKVSTWFPATPIDRIDGVLTPSGSEAFGLRLSEEHGGCWNVQHFADKDQPANFGLSDARAWTSVAVIKSARAYFHASPGAKPGKAYAVRGDGLGVRAVRAGWLQVDFVGPERTTSGWIKASDVYAAP